MMRKNVLFGLVFILVISFFACFAVGDYFIERFIGEPTIFKYMSPNTTANVTTTLNLSVVIYNTSGGRIVNVSYIWYLISNNSLMLNYTQGNVSVNQTIFLNQTFSTADYLADGKYNLSVFAINSSGVGVLNGSISKNIIVDNTPPAVTSITPATVATASGGVYRRQTPAGRFANSFTHNATFNVTVTDAWAGVASNVTFYFDDNGSYGAPGVGKVGFNRTALNVTLFGKSIWNASFNVSKLRGGQHTIRVYAYDLFGRLNRTETTTFIVNTPPLITVVAQAIAGKNISVWNTMGRNFTINTSISDNLSKIDNFILMFSNGTGKDFNITGNNSPVGWGPTMYYWNRSYNLSTLFGGLDQTLTIFVNDTYKNWNNTIVYTFSVNSYLNVSFINSSAFPPLGTNLVTIQNYSSDIGNKKINISVTNYTVLDDVIFMFSNGTGNDFNLTGYIAGSRDAGMSSVQFANVTYNFSKLTEGNNTVTIFVNDTHKNWNHTIFHYFYMDYTAPTVAVVAPLNNPTYDGRNSTTAFVWNNISFNVTALDSLVGVKNVSFSLDNATGTGANYTGYVGRVINFSGQWRMSYNISTMKRGSHLLTVYAYDGAGNLNRTASLTFDVNTPLNVTFVAPAGPTAAQNYSVVKGNVTFNVTIVGNRSLPGGTDGLNNISTVRFRFSNGTGTDFNRSATNASGYWRVSYNVSALQEGLQNVRVFVNDTWGNWNNSVSINFSTDYTAPTPALTKSSTSTSSTLVIAISTDADAESCASNVGTVVGTGATQTLTYTGLSAGTAYTISVNCKDEAGNVGGLQSSFTTDSDTTSGSGASGSGGGSSAGIAGQFGKEVWASINAGETATVEVANGVVGVTEVSFVVPSRVYGAWVKVAKVDGLPSSMTSFGGAVYKNVEITKGVALKDDNIKDAVIDFKVEKTWLIAKGLTQNQVAIYRYVDSKWTELGTTFVKDDGTSIHYTAKTPGFSYFIIGEKGVGAAAEVPAGEVPAGEVPAGEVPAGEVPAGEVPAGEVPAGEVAQKATWPWVVAIALVVIIAAFVIIYLKRRR